MHRVDPKYLLVEIMAVKAYMGLVMGCYGRLLGGVLGIGLLYI